MKLVLVLNVAASLYMLGLIWMVQIVHYPLMDRVPAERFSRFERDHQRLTTYVVAPVMLIEMATAILLVLQPPTAELRVWLTVALVLLGAAWLTTWLFSVPAHSRLTDKFDATTHAHLVHTNWLRTVAWSLRAAIMGWLTYRLLS